MSNDIKTKAPPRTEAPSATVMRGRTERTPEPTTPRELRVGRQHAVPGLSGGLILAAVGDAFRKLDPRTLWRNPVMFVVEIVSVVTTILVIREAISGVSILFSAQIAFWLWFTVVFANLAEAVAEGRGKI